MKVYTTSLDPGPDFFAAYDSVSREKLWRRLQKNKTPQYLRDIIPTMYTGCLYLFIDGDNFSEEVAPIRGLKQGFLLRYISEVLHNIGKLKRWLANKM
jgi:hypothetical protein